jgi:hypothetical protein
MMSENVKQQVEGPLAGNRWSAARAPQAAMQLRLRP